MLGCPNCGAAMHLNDRCSICSCPASRRAEFETFRRESDWFSKGYWTKSVPTKPGIYVTADAGGSEPHLIAYGMEEARFRVGNIAWWWSEPMPDMPPVPDQKDEDDGHHGHKH